MLHDKFNKCHWHIQFLNMLLCFFLEAQCISTHILIVSFDVSDKFLSHPTYYLKMIYNLHVVLHF